MRTQNTLKNNVRRRYENTKNTEKPMRTQKTLKNNVRRRYENTQRRKQANTLTNIHNDRTTTAYTMEKQRKHPTEKS